MPTSVSVKWSPLPVTILAGCAILAFGRDSIAAACIPPPAGIIGWWAGESNANDSLGLNNGTIQGGTSFAPGEVGQAFVFDGTNGYVQMPDARELSPHVGWAGELTLETWIRFTRLPQWDPATSQPDRAIVVKGGPGNWEYGLYLTTNAEPAFVVWQLNGSGYAGVSGSSITTNQWHHIVGVLRKGQFVRLYVDGQLARESTSFSGDTAEGNSPLYIGRRGDGQFFDGQVDEVSLYGRALGAGEVNAIYLAGVSGKCSGITGSSVPYFTDFENGPGPEWMLPLSENTETLGFTRFTGRFANGMQMLTLTNLVAGQTYTVGFDFYVIDTWDGSYSGTGDFFNVNVNGVQVFHQTFSNYNGNPPNNPQSFPGQPDEGRANFGFNPSWVDAIYRNIEVTFNASNTLTTITFTGQNLEQIDNEAWAVDNVSVVPSSTLTNTFVRSTTLPPAATTNSLAIDSFGISANWPLSSSTATNAANYSLIEAGPDGILGTADDTSFPLTPTLPGPGGRSVQLTLASTTLQPGHYRFQTASGLQGTNGNSVPVFTREFYLANPVLGVLETASNDSIGGATPLPMTESPAGSGFFTAFAVGLFASTSDVDYWRFDAEVGDVVTIRLESESQGVYPQLYLQNSAGQNLATVGGDSGGTAQIQTYAIGLPGTYYLKVWSTSNRSRYWMRVDQSRGPQLEVEDNSSQANANPLNLAFSPGLYQARVAGSLPAADTAGDFYQLGTLNVGNAISVTALYPNGSSLTAGQTTLSVQIDGNSVAVATNTSGNLNYTVATNGVYYVHVETLNQNLRAQYLLNISVSDVVPPLITGTSLPAEGTTTTSIVDRFTLNFSESLNALSVSNSANYSLISAGTDGIFGTSDDSVYTVATTGYSSGLSAGYSITDGPLQPGQYRLTVGINILDRAANHMAAPFVRNFTVANIPGYILENRNNDVLGLATSLSLSPTTNSNGTVAWIGNVGTPAQPEGIAAGRFNADTNLDLVTANWSSANITIYTNNGAGFFTAVASIGTGNNPIGVATGDFNGDGKADIAVANYSSSSISILVGDGNAGFVLITNLTGFNNPYGIVVADVNNDGKADLVVPNYGNGTFSVVLGNGNGTFQSISNYPAGSNPASVAVGDVNNDGLPDIAVANYTSGTVSLFTNAGNGNFVLAANVPCGPNPRSVAIADVTGDGKADLVTANAGDNSISVMAGNGDGTFRPRGFYLGGFTNPYQLLLVDLNGDGKLDVVVPGYGNNTFSIFLNDGAGVFTNYYSYGTSGNPIGVAAGDFSGDGRTDLAFCHYYGNYISLWAGNASTPLAEDPPGSGLRSAFGRGTRSNSSDVDFWQFSGNAGDQCIVAVDTVGNPSNSQLYFQIQQVDGSVLTSWYPANNGWGQSGVVTLPKTGTYCVRVAANNDYQGEYRIRVTLARPPLQLQSESNSTFNSANAVTLTLTNNNHLGGAIAGYLSVGDGGDYYSLGNLLGGATINLSFREPASSGLAEILSIYNTAGTLMTNSLPGVANFTFIVPPGSNGVYYVVVTASQASYAGGSTTAIGFNGSASYVDFGAWAAGSQWTLQAWANPSSLPGGRHAIVGGVAENRDWAINLQDGQFGLDLGPATAFRSGDPVTPGQWYQITGTYDGTNALLYINGQLRTVGTLTSYAGTAQGVRAGSEVCCSGNTFPGLINDVRIWNRPLSASEIAANLNAILTGAEPNLLGYWRFNEGVGSTTADLSTFNHTGTLYNGAYWVNLGPTNAMPPSLPAQYILSFDLASPAPPAITSVTLPVNNSTNASIITSFSIGFNEDMDPRFTWLSRDIYRFNGRSYLITDSASDWQTAENAAVALGGHLAGITNASVNTFLNQTFSRYGELWIGLNVFAGRGWSWSSGDPVAYQNWANGEPNNSGGYEFATKMLTSGQWADIAYWTSLRGVIEVTNTADTDTDGLVNSLDPYPNDPKNAFDLRAAGPDGVFDTADDVVYRIYSTGYSSGLSSGFAIADGPLQPGSYRFQVTTAFRDRFGNTLPSAFNQFFTVAAVSGFIEEARRTNGVSTTSLSLSSSNQLDGSFNYTYSSGVGAQPYWIAQADFNGDGYLDVVTANWNSGGITILTNDNHGNFVVLTNITTGSNPDSVITGDFNGDHQTDIAVANWSSGTVTILLGNGAGGFTLATNLPGFTNPWNFTAADFNHDGILDLAVPSYNGGSVTVLFGDGTGNFTNSATYTVGSGPETVRAGDLNGDGNPDLVVANYNSSSFSVLMGSSNGAFTVTTNYPTPSNPRYTTLADVNGDGKLDAITVNNGNYVSVAFGNGDGTFQPRTDYNIGSGDTYQVVVADLNNDGAPDLIIPGYGANRLYTMLNNGDGTFGATLSYNNNGNIGGSPIGVVVGDYNHDGILDIAGVNWNWNNVFVLLGNNTEGLAYDPAGTGLHIAAARGNLADSSDLDYWTFSALANDRLFIAVESPGSPGGSSLLYRIYYPDGSQWTYFYSDGNGRGQISLVVPASGTYTIRVEPNNQYYGEFRLRVTLGRPPLQLENEDNGSLANANALSFSNSGGRQLASVLGYLGSADNSDIFRLGNLASGTLITLGLAEPATSGLLDELVILNSAGGVATYGAAGATNLSYLVPPGSNGTYYAQVWDAGPTSALNFGGANSNKFALRFDGGSTWIAFTNAVVPTSGDFTVEAWAYSFGSDGYHDILSQGSGGNAFYLGYRSWMARAGDGWEYIGSVTWPQNAWHHFAVVKSSTDTLLFIDGVQVAARGSPIPNPVAADGLRIGRQYGPYGEYWGGDIDEVRIWNVSRSATDLQLNMSNRLAGTESGLVGYWRFDEGANNVVFDATTNSFNGTFQNYPVWLPCGRTNLQPSSIFSQYVLSLAMTNTQPPVIVSDSLPAEGSTNTSVVDRFSLNFSQDMGASTVTDPASYELRCAGPDNAFGTGDDILYSVANSPLYVSGTSASYLITDGPLQPGHYRFTARTTITDPLGNPIAAPYARNFTLANVPGFFFESRNNNSLATATSLSLAPTNRPDGSFSSGPSLGLGSSPERIAAGHLNADTNMDLVVCQWNYPGISVLLGNGDGSFTVKTNYTTGSGAWSLALGHFNGDPNLDLAVANYSANTVTVLAGNGDGTFQVLSNYSVGSQPYHIVTGDFNNDGKTDLAVPILNSGNVSILFGNGDGTFQPPVNYASGSGPVYAAVGDVNGDGKQDLVVANYYSDNVSLFLGNGSGTFAAPVTLATGHNPRAIVLRDLNGDGKLDLAVFNAGDNAVSVMFGNGDGSFQPRVNYGTGTSDGYEILAADVNGDGWPDLVVGGYNNSVITVLLNRGDGTFDTPTVYPMPSRIVGLIAADFNNDGLMDIAAASDSGNAVWTLLGNNTEPVAADGVLRTTAGRGNLASGDVDYWSFTGEAGDVLDLATQNPGDPGGSALLYRIYYPNGSQWTYFYTDGNGRGQIGATLPVSGTYYIRVEQYYNYVGEYRFRLTLARPPVQVESESNDNTSQANSLTFTNVSGHRLATVLGYIGSADGSGDYFQLGNLSAGAGISLGAWQPPSSGFADVLEVYNAAGSLVTSSILGATNLSYTVPVSGAGAYYAHIRAAYGALPPAPLHPTGSMNTLLYSPNSYSEALLAVPPSALAVTFWFRTPDPNAGLFSVSDGGGGHDRHVYLSNGGNINARLYSNQTISSSGLALADGNWHYVVYTYGSAISGQMIYVDGVQVAYGTKSSSDFTSNNRVRFGYSQDAPDNYLTGYLDEARIWNYAFAAVDVSRNMTNSLTGSESGLIGYWRFNEGTGPVSVDLTTNAHNATLINGPTWAPAVSTGVNVMPGLFAQYLLTLDVSDAVAPAITSATLPANGSTNLSIIDRFTLNFTKDLDPAINNLNRNIRTYNGHGYTITDSGSSWYAAETQAHAFGGHLVALNDSLENAFVYGAFGSYGNFWIGLSDEAQHGAYVWSGGDPFAYTNWDAGQPNNSNNQDYGVMRGGGVWADYAASANYRGVVEVAGPDSDGDGIPDTLDPYPYDPYNGVDLRSAGPDGVFDTPDDVVYRLTHDTYTSGTALSFYVADGPLQPGKYRFMVTGSLRDLFGNAATPFVEYFTISGVSGYVNAGRTNNSSSATTALALTEDPAGLKSAGARGKLFDTNDRDWWSFAGANGDLLLLSAEVPGDASGAALEYQVYAPNGTRIVDLVPDYYTSLGQSAPVVLPTNGTYLVQVQPYYGYYGEYRFRLATVTPPKQFELEDNGSLANATPLTLLSNGNSQSISVAGYVRTPSDLDYFNLGTVSNGYSIFLNVRQPSSSPLVPIVSVYNSANVYQSEAPGGNPNDSIAEIRVTQTGTYYALVRGSLESGGLDAQYLLDVQVLPTGTVLFPNLVVSSIALPPASGLQSGQLMTYAFTVGNIGSTNTIVANWLDRAALSTDTVLGNADDIPLGFFPHSGALNPGDSYTVTNTFQLPDGLSGDFHIIAQTDAGNAVNEFVFEGDNTTVSATTFHVDLAPYPDVRVENLAVAGPDMNNVYTLTWNTANRGTGPAPGGFYERFNVRNVTSGAQLANLDQPIATTLSPNATVPHTQMVVATNAGNYLVTILTDSHNDLWEFDGISHATAEANNTATTNFAITAYYSVALSSSPPGAGTLTGAGIYGSGSPVTVTAAPNTNFLPYLFVNWTEGGAFQSARTNYSFIIAANRSLLANFTLPSFLLSASNNPPNAGTVSGQGSYFYGSTNILTANANFGYRFTNWSENGSIVATTPSFSIIITNNRFVVANYIEANTVHVVTTATSPTNLLTVAGAGTYTNGQSVTINAPASYTNPPNIYSFRQFQLNGTSAGNSPSLNKTFSTLDPTNMQYIAFYDAISILPLITNVVVNDRGVVPATTNFLVSIQFNRSMDTNFTPLVVITNPAASVQATVSAGGTWSQGAVSNDTFIPPPITFTTGMDGTNNVFVSLARDLLGGVLAPTNILALVVDVTPPPNPVLALVGSNSVSAAVSWAGYAPPPDLNAFRVYLSTNTFSSVAGLTAVSSLGASARSFTYSGLVLDQPYYAALAAVDAAGNSSPLVNTLPFTLSSTVPSPVPLQVTSVGPSSALVSWNSYNTSALLGFAGFQLYCETAAFSSVAGHAIRQILDPGARSVQIDGLDRTQTYYFAVVGYNGNGAFNANVTTATWSDPYAGAVTSNLTIGGGGQAAVDILQSITVVSNAVLTIAPGTTLRFAPGTSLTIQQGALSALGTPLDPIILTSANDQPGQTPATGDWGGVLLGSGAGASVMRDVFVNYGAGLTLSNCAPRVDDFSALNNTLAGLTVQAGAVLNTTNALLTYNGIGAQQLGTGQLTVLNSSIKNNGTNALALGGLTLHANQTWWGSAAAGDISASLQGAVDASGYLSGEPLLTPALGTVNNVTQVGSPSVDLRLACRTADSMRLSEDSTFTGVFFGPFTNRTTFALSAGGGQKSVFAQFRSLTGQTSTPVSVTVNYLTAGPTITAFDLMEGEVLTRPLLVSGSATAALGMAALEFYVDGAGQGTNAGASFSEWFDVRNLTIGVHRFELLARDQSGNIATLSRNVVISPTPPPAPLIVSPATDLIVNSNTVQIAGTAEPFIEVRLFGSGALAGITNAAADGSFSFTDVPLVEGLNQFTAQAGDALGSASSAIRNITLDTQPPAQLVMDPVSYQPNVGLLLSWHFAASGKRAALFQVFWSQSPITNLTQATGSSLILAVMNTSVQGLASGNYYFYVVGYDALGNASPISSPVQALYDPIPPTFNVAFDKASPVGLGSLHVVLSASKPLNGAPTLTVQPYGNPPALLPVTNTAVNFYEGDMTVTALWSSGPVQLKVSAVDLVGNAFNGPPTGPPLVVDITPPSGTIGIAPAPPIQATNNTTIAVSLQLTKPPQAATTPTLNFGPPIGAPVPVTLAGADTNWNGTLILTPVMGSGFGHFTLTVTDGLGNVGHSIDAGSALEIYNTAVPSPPGQPVHFFANSLAGGQVLLTWSNVPSAEIYRVYSGPGTNYLVVPTNLIADNVLSNYYVDLPAADGFYCYAVTAVRRGAEGTNSIVRVAVSDRTPPPPPTNVVVQLAANGLQITWQPSPGETPDHYNVYRNGTYLGTAGAPIPVIDYPPRGIMTYTVSAADALGNEAFSDPVTFQLLVGAVNNLVATAAVGQAPVLNWSSPDPTAMGFNLYRNGIKQNATPLSAATFTDLLPLGASSVNYAVTALNATNAESAARSVTVYPVALSLLVNSAGGTSNGPPTTSYFDDYQLSVSNLSATTSLPLQQVQVQRLEGGSPAYSLVTPVNNVIDPGNGYALELAVPSSSNNLAQSVQVQAFQQTDSEGSSVIYQQSFTLPSVLAPATMVMVTANQLPLAGGLTPFNVQVYNRGYAPMYFAVTRGNGSQPGDVYISVKNPQGAEVNRTPFNGTPSGMLFYGDVGYLVVPPGGSTSFTVPNVLVPEALASNIVTFQAVVSAIYDRYDPAGQQRSGPLVGSMQSALSQTPYYGTAQTDRQLYSNDQPILITGQALDRITGQPVPNVPLNVGFAARGAYWYESIVTDTNGNYSYAYNAPPGLGGTLTIWAAHPDVVDLLNQAQVTIYRIYATPQGGDIRMSKNDTLPFGIGLLNPADISLTGFTVTFAAYEMQGTNQVPTSKIHGNGLFQANFVLGGGQQQPINLQLAADVDAPDNAIGVFTLTSAEGAATTFTANISLLPAVPIITVVQPDIGYVEVSLNRGALLSQQVTIKNSGLKVLQGVMILPPTNVTWMLVNLPTAANGTIQLPDLGIGQSNAFTVVFTPPTNTDLGFFQDKLTITGTNAQAGFDVNLYALVTSANQGAVQFYVDDILGLDVPNATVRLRNTDLQVELPPAQTDINGLVTITNLQEGNWSWQVSAAGHSANVGVVTVVADQTVNVSTRLPKSVVTVNFTVTPVPFTDQYEITIEQTFETHVPMPVLVMTPTYQHFDNVSPGFQVSYIVTAKNEGLIQMTDLTITGSQDDSASFVPLINYVPVLLPQQSVDIPFTFTYFGTNGPGGHQGGAGSAVLGCSGIPNADVINGFIAGMNAFANAFAQCAKDQKLIAACACVAITYQIVTGATKGAKAVAGALQGGLGLAKYLGCILGKLLGPINTGLGIPLAYDMGSPPQGVQQFNQIEAGCFASGTQVLLADGSMQAIDQVKAGAVVKTGPDRRAMATVAGVYEQQADRLREIRFEVPGQAQPGVVRATDEHWFWQDGRGWVPAVELKVGAWLLNEHRQRVRITANEPVKGPCRVYTLKLSGDAAFYANGVLVHDVCGGLAPPEPARSSPAPAESSSAPVNLPN